jgi:hypothetical protein
MKSCQKRWAHRISKHSATKVTHFELVYGQEAVLPVEVNLDALRVPQQNELSVVDYHNLMLDKLDEVLDKRVKALGKAGDLVWKTILPIGSRSSTFGKWSPNLEGPYRIEEVILGNSYMVQSIQGISLPRALNGKYLKRYYPSVWQDARVRKQLILLLSPLAQTWQMKHHEHYPKVKFGLKCLLIRKFN